MGVLLKRRVMHTVLYVISIVIALITGFPFLFLVINSFKGMGEYLTNIWMLPKEPYLGQLPDDPETGFSEIFSQQCYCVCNQRVHYCSGIFHDFLYICQNALSGKKSAVLCYYRRNDDSCTYDPDSYVYPVKSV